MAGDFEEFWGCGGSGGVLGFVLLLERGKVGTSKACFEWVDEG